MKAPAPNPINPLTILNVPIILQELMVNIPLVCFLIGVSCRKYNKGIQAKVIATATQNIILKVSKLVCRKYEENRSVVPAKSEPTIMADAD